MIELPKTKKVPSENIWDYIFLWAGAKKLGKSSFIAQWPEHFILGGEPGNLKHLQANYVDIHDWAELISYLRLLEENKNYCKIVFVDEISAIYTYCVNNVRKELKLSDVEPLGYVGWQAVRLRFEAFVQRLHSLGIGVGYTTHTEVVTSTDIKGREISRLETAMSKQCNEIMDGITNFWGVMLFDQESHRVMRIVGDSYVKAGNSLAEKHFRYKGFALKEIPMGNSPIEAYFNFLAAFNNQLAVPDESLVR